MKRIRKTNLFKKARFRCNRKVLINVCNYLFSSVLYFALHIYFRPGQECGKCDQILATKKKRWCFYHSLYIFITTSFVMFVTSILSI